MSIGEVAADFGKGLLAGLAGTAAMTVSSTLGMKLSGRPASQTPAQAAEEVLGVGPKDEEAEARFSNLVHWGYGAGWGGVRGLLASAGLPGPAANLGLVWGGDQVILPALDVAGPGLQVRRDGDGPLAPRRLCHGHRSRLLLPGQEPDPPALSRRFFAGRRPRPVMFVER
jgi:hypothetical protein